MFHNQHARENHWICMQVEQNISLVDLLGGVCSKETQSEQMQYGSSTMGLEPLE